MSFYSSISLLYDEIFPFSPAQFDFVLRHLQDPAEADVLEIGCASGSLIIELAQVCRFAAGIDIDDQMTAAAQKKQLSKGCKALILSADMRNIATCFSADSFDLILSFGNTLVHLSSPDEMLKVLISAASLLRDGGRLLLQTINYDRILDDGIRSLPTIENERIRFERNYALIGGIGRDTVKVEFTARLTDKAEQKTGVQQVTLYPLRKDELRDLLVEAGFSRLHWYGGFDMSPSVRNSIPLIAAAEKVC